MRGIALVFALVLLGTRSAAANPPQDQRLSELVAALDSVRLPSCSGTPCTAQRKEHKQRIAQWLSEMRTGVDNGTVGCATLRGKQPGKWKITGFWCEGDVYPAIPDVPGTSGEPEWVVLRWKCMQRQCFLTNLRANGDESRKAAFRVRLKGNKPAELHYFPYQPVQPEWIAE